MNKSIIIPTGKNKPFPKVGVVQRADTPPTIEEFKAKLNSIMSGATFNSTPSPHPQNFAGNQSFQPNRLAGNQSFQPNRLAGNSLYAGNIAGASNTCSDLDVTGQYTCSNVTFDDTGIRYSFSNFDTIINYIMGVLKLKSVFTSLGEFSSTNWNTTTITPANVQSYILQAIQYMFDSADYRKFFIPKYSNYSANLFSPDLSSSQVTDVCWILNRLVVSANFSEPDALQTYGTFKIVPSIDCRPATCLIGPAISCAETGTCQVSTDQVLNALSDNINKLLQNNAELISNGVTAGNLNIVLKEEDLVDYSYVNEQLYVDTSMNQVWFIDTLTDFYLSVYRQIICSNGVDQTKQHRAAYYLTQPTGLTTVNNATANIQLLRADRELLKLIKINSGSLRRTNKKILETLRERINILDPSSKANCGFPSISCNDNLDSYTEGGQYSISSTDSSSYTTDSTCSSKNCGGSRCYPLYLTDRQMRKLTNLYLIGYSNELLNTKVQDESNIIIAKNLLYLYNSCIGNNSEADTALKENILAEIANNKVAQAEMTNFVSYISYWYNNYAYQQTISDWRRSNFGSQNRNLPPPSGNGGMNNGGMNNGGMNNGGMNNGGMNNGGMNNGGMNNGGMNNGGMNNGDMNNGASAATYSNN